MGIFDRKIGAVRPFVTAAVIALFAASSVAQVVEKGRTFADLTASHPCDTGLTNRIARVTDCDAADDIGDGEGAFQCWAICDGSAPWVAQAIGGGGGNFLALSGEYYQAVSGNVDIYATDEVTYISVNDGALILGSGGSVLIGATTQLRFIPGPAPSAANDTCETGAFSFDTSYVYICVDTATWKRAALSTWP